MFENTENKPKRDQEWPIKKCTFKKRSHFSSFHWYHVPSPDPTQFRLPTYLYTYRCVYWPYRKYLSVDICFMDVKGSIVTIVKLPLVCFLSCNIQSYITYKVGHKANARFKSTLPKSTFLVLHAVWPVKNCQMSISDAQKWFQ